MRGTGGNIVRHPAKLGTPTSVPGLDLNAWLVFFAKHQDPKDTSVSWEDGMIFRPTTLKKAADKQVAPHDAGPNTPTSITSTDNVPTAKTANALTTTNHPGNATTTCPRISVATHGSTNINFATVERTETTSTTKRKTTAPAKNAPKAAPASSSSKRKADNVSRAADGDTSRLHKRRHGVN